MPFWDDKELLNETSFLSSSASEFVKQMDSNYIFEFVAKQICRLEPDSSIIITEFDPYKKNIHIKHVVAEEKRLKIASELLKQNLKNFGFKINTTDFINRVDRFGLKESKNLHELAFGKIPSIICFAIEKAVNIKRIYSTPFALKKGDILGSVIIIKHTDSPLNHENALNALINQAAVALQKWKVQSELINAERKYYQIFENAIEGIFKCAPNGIFLDVNPSFCRMLNYESAKEFLGSVNNINNLNKTLLEKILKHKVNSISDLEEQLLNKNKNLVWVSMNINIIRNEKNNVLSFDGMLTEITTRKKFEEELKKAKDKLELELKIKTDHLILANKELNDAKRLSEIGKLAASVAHELRNPLGVISIAIFNIRRKAKDERLETHFTNIEKKILESNHIISNLLNYSRLKIPAYEKTDICKLINECVDSAQARFNETGIMVKVSRLPMKDISIEIDPYQIRGILNNILNNAFQAIPQDTDKIGEIKLDAQIDGDKLLISVKDNGCGIDKEDLEKVCDPFFTRKTKGTGLGLSLVKEIVTLHNGTVEIKSKTGKGTNMTIALPLNKTHVLQNDSKDTPT